MKRPMFFFEGDGTGGGGTGGDGTIITQTPPGGTGTPPAFSWAKEDGTLSEGWLDKLTPELRGNPSLRVIGSVPDLAKSYVETKGLMGKRLEAPGEGATPEQITAWRKTVGAPEKPEGYYGEAKTLRPEAIPENLWDTAGEKKFLEIAHKHHLPPAAVKEILGYYGESIAQNLQASQADESAVLQGETSKLRQAWGGDFEANLNVASRVAQTVGLDPKTHPIFTNADVVQAFARMGKLMSEDKLVRGDNVSISGSINERIRDITDSKSTSALAREYRGEFGPERQASAQQQLHQLMQSTGK